MTSGNGSLWAANPVRYEEGGRWEGFRQIRVLAADGVTQEQKGRLSDSLGDVSKLDTLQLLTDLMRGLAIDLGFKVNIVSDADHSDPLRLWVTVAFLPGDSAGKDVP